MSSVVVWLPQMLFVYSCHDSQQADFPEPFKPSTPIFAPGKKESEMSLEFRDSAEHLANSRHRIDVLCHVTSYSLACDGSASLAAAKAGAADHWNALVYATR